MMPSTRQRIIVGLLMMGLIVLPTAFVHGQSGSKASLGIFEPFQMAPDQQIEVPVTVSNVQDLYALDITLEFDPALVQVEDSDPSTPGIQAALGNFLDPGLLLFNTADNEKGTVHLAMSQYNPSEAKSGEGIVLVIHFKAVKEGISPLTLSNVQLATREGTEIPSEGVNSTLTILSDAPTQAATYPVADTQGMIVVATLTPVLSNTPTPSPTALTLSTATPTAITPKVAAAKITPTEIKTTEQESTAETAAKREKSSQPQSYFLVDHWWIVLIILILVAVVAYSLYRSSNNSSKK